jgi:hypothetical protein
MKSHIVGHYFVLLAGVVFVASAILKLLDLAGTHDYLREYNSLFYFLTNRQVVAIAAVVEMVVALHLFSRDEIRRRLLSVLWLCVIIAVYKIGLSLTLNIAPCSCFGLLPSILRLTTAQVERISWALIALLGGGATLLVMPWTSMLWKHEQARV